MPLARGQVRPPIVMQLSCATSKCEFLGRVSKGAHHGDARQGWRRVGTLAYCITPRFNCADAIGIGTK